MQLAGSRHHIGFGDFERISEVAATREPMVVTYAWEAEPSAHLEEELRDLLGTILKVDKIGDHAVRTQEDPRRAFRSIIPELHRLHFRVWMWKGTDLDAGVLDRKLYVDFRVRPEGRPNHPDTYKNLPEETRGEETLGSS